MKKEVTFVKYYLEKDMSKVCEGVLNMDAPLGELIERCLKEAEAIVLEPVVKIVEL